MFHLADRPRVNTWHSTLPPPHNGISLAACNQPAERGRLHPGGQINLGFTKARLTPEILVLVEGSGQTPNLGECRDWENRISMVVSMPSLHGSNVYCKYWESHHRALPTVDSHLRVRILGCSQKSC